jgi:hypothetical protein
MAGHQWQLVALARVIGGSTVHWCNRCGALAKTAIYASGGTVEHETRRTYCAIGGTWTTGDPGCREEGSDDGEVWARRLSDASIEHWLGHPAPS